MTGAPPRTPKRVVYLHLGAHKTATTSLQRCIAKNSEQLRAQGILPLSGPQKSGPASTFDYRRDLQRPVRDYASAAKGSRQRGKALRRLRAFGSRIEPGFDRLLISDETLLGPPLLPGAQPTAYPEAARRLRALRVALADFEVRPILYIRPQAEFLESWYVQTVLEGNPQTFADFLDAIDVATFRWNGLIRRIERNIPDQPILVRSFESIRGGFLEYARDFFALFAKTERLDLVLVRENPRLSGVGLSLFRWLAGYLPRRRYKELRRLLQPILASKRLPPPQLLTAEQRREIASLHHEDVERALRTSPREPSSAAEKAE